MGIFLTKISNRRQKAKSIYTHQIVLIWIYLIAVDLDGAHICSPYSCVGEETMFPLPHVHHSLVKDE